LFNNTLFKDETLIIIESDIIEFKDILTMYWNKNMKCIEH
jgi:hypothetical protein